MAALGRQTIEDLREDNDEQLRALGVARGRATRPRDGRFSCSQPAWRASARHRQVAL